MERPSSPPSSYCPSSSRPDGSRGTTNTRRAGSGATPRLYATLYGFAFSFFPRLLPSCVADVAAVAHGRRGLLAEKIGGKLEPGEVGSIQRWRRLTKSKKLELESDSEDGELAVLLGHGVAGDAG